MSQRLKRMGDQVQRELSDLIRLSIKDPRLGGLVTISGVKVSSDLGYAEVYFTVMGRELGDDQTEAAHRDTLELLNGAAGFLRAELGRRIKTRFTPRLRFHYDTATAHGNYMTQLITKAVADLPALADESETAEAESTPD
ncbi:MAG: hypothetical protein RLY58_199 [Pseudomonadota bacterium]|jgi:ribosome-binding factor A